MYGLKHRNIISKWQKIKTLDRENLKTSKKKRRTTVTKEASHKNTNTTIDRVTNISKAKKKNPQQSKQSNPAKPKLNKNRKHKKLPSPLNKLPIHRRTSLRAELRNAILYDCIWESDDFEFLLAFLTCFFSHKFKLTKLPEKWKELTKIKKNKKIKSCNNSKHFKFLTWQQIFKLDRVFFLLNDNTCKIQPNWSSKTNKAWILIKKIL